MHAPCLTVLAYEDGPHFQHSGLHGAEIALDFLQRQVRIVNCLRGKLNFSDIGDDDITTGQVHGALFGLRIHRRDDLPALQMVER